MLVFNKKQIKQIFGESLSQELAQENIEKFEICEEYLLNFIEHKLEKNTEITNDQNIIKLRKICARMILKNIKVEMQKGWITKCEEYFIKS